MKYPRCHFSLLVLASLGFWVAGSGCAEYDSFVADFSGGHAASPPQSATSPPGNWLDQLLPDEAPGPCQHCQHGPMGAGQMSTMPTMGPGPNGLAYETPPTPQYVPARLHPVPTHPVFSSHSTTILATAKRPGEPGSFATERPGRNGEIIGPKSSERPVLHDPSPRTARANPAPKKELNPLDVVPSDSLPAPEESAEPKSDVQPISAIGERRQPTVAKRTPSSPLQLNAPANAEPIAPTPAIAATSANAPAAAAPAAITPLPKGDSGEGWHPVLHGGYSSR